MILLSVSPWVAPYNEQIMQACLTKVIEVVYSRLPTGLAQRSTYRVMM